MFLTKNLIALIILSTLSLSIGSCSSSDSTKLQGEKLAADSKAALLDNELELFMSRATLSGTKFEHFKLLGQKLFVECGDIKAGKQTTNSQDVLKIEPATAQEIALSAGSVFEVIDQHPFKFENPGSNKNLFDPGQFTLVVASGEKQHKLQSSFDDVTNGDFKAERRIKKTAELLRGAAQDKLCGNKSFFTLGVR